MAFSFILLNVQHRQCVRIEHNNILYSLRQIEGRTYLEIFGFKPLPFSTADFRTVVYSVGK